MINTFLRGCSDHQDQFFCLFELKKLSGEDRCVTTLTTAAKETKGNSTLLFFTRE